MKSKQPVSFKNILSLMVDFKILGLFRNKGWFIPESLSWEQGYSKKWEIWKKWHKDAAQSTGIQKNMETFEVTVGNSSHLKSYYEHHLPFYKAIRLCGIGMKSE